MIKHETYRDGGTRCFTNFPFHEKLKFNDEVCQDNRIGSSTKGEWYLGYPGKDSSRLLTDQEKDFAIQEIIYQLGKELRRLDYLYRDIRESNKDYLFKDNFNQVFSLKWSRSNGGNSCSGYVSKNNFTITDEDNRATLKNEEGIVKGSGTLQECFILYNILNEI